MKLTIEISDQKGEVKECRTEEYPGIQFVSSITSSGDNTVLIRGYRVEHKELNELDQLFKRLAD